MPLIATDVTDCALYEEILRDRRSGQSTFPWPEVLYMKVHPLNCISRKCPSHRDAELFDGRDLNIDDRPGVPQLTLYENCIRGLPPSSEKTRRIIQFCRTLELALIDAEYPRSEGVLSEIRGKLVEW